jgi:hypothetical protein
LQSAGELVPRWATILVKIEILEVNDQGHDNFSKHHQEAFAEIDTNGDEMLSREELSVFYR